jgi:hypothetical protein
MISGGDNTLEYFVPTDDVWFLDRLFIQDNHALVIASELRRHRPSKIYLNNNRYFLFRCFACFPVCDHELIRHLSSIGDVGAQALASAIVGSNSLNVLDLRRYLARNCSRIRESHSSRH